MPERTTTRPSRGATAPGAILVATAALLLAATGAAGQTAASGTLTPAGPPLAPPTRTDAGGACIVELRQASEVAGTLDGRLVADYRILIRGPCGQPAGTYAEEWIAHGTFDGTVDGEPATGTFVYTAAVEPGGSVRGRITLGDGVVGALEVTGEMSEGRLSYAGSVEAGG